MHGKGIMDYIMNIIRKRCDKLLLGNMNSDSAKIVHAFNKLNQPLYSQDV